MRRNTIGWQRGSVRGPPPQVYIPFGEYHNTDTESDEWKDAIRFLKVFLISMGVWFVIWLALLALSTFGERWDLL